MIGFFHIKSHLPTVSLSKNKIENLYKKAMPEEKIKILKQQHYKDDKLDGNVESPGIPSNPFYQESLYMQSCHHSCKKSEKGHMRFHLK